MKKKSRKKNKKVYRLAPTRLPLMPKLSVDQKIDNKISLHLRNDSDRIRSIVKQELHLYETEIGYKLFDRDLEFLAEQCTRKVMLRVQMVINRIVAEARAQFKADADKIISKLDRHSAVNPEIRLNSVDLPV